MSAAVAVLRGANNADAASTVLPPVSVAVAVFVPAEKVADAAIVVDPVDNDAVAVATPIDDAAAASVVDPPVRLAVAV